MIFLEKFRDGRYGINFSSDQEDNIVIKLIDGYTGLTVYQDRMTVLPGIIFFCSHDGRGSQRIYEIWSSDTKNLLLRVSAMVHDGISIESLDRYGHLKNFKYNNNEDNDPGLPLYEIFLDKIYEKNFRVEEGDTVVDIGGNIGIFSYYSICRGAKKVYCFEPSPQQCSTIRENFKFDNLQIEEAAVSGSEGTISFFINPTSSINSSILPANGSTEVKCKSVNLENYLDSVGEDKIDYLKIDCEGGEYEIFESLSLDFLKHKVEKMCVEYHYNSGRKIMPILEKLDSAGFNVEFERDPSQIDDDLGIFYAWKK